MSTQALITIKGMTEKKLHLLEKLGITSVGELLTHFPREYEDLSHLKTLENAFFSQEKMLVYVEVVSVSVRYTQKRVLLTQIKVKDDIASATLLMFGKQNHFGKIEQGEKYLVSGIFVYKDGKIVSSSFSIEEKLEKDTPITSLHHSRIVPLYNLTEGLTQKTLRELISNALEETLPTLNENIPSFLVNGNNLMNRKESLQEIHFPTSFEKLEKAKERLKYFELFKLQFQFALKRFYFKTTKNRVYTKNPKLVDKLLKNLPFTLTASQEKVLSEIKEDLYSPRAMHRLLLGDVGSGKTLVALVSLLLVIESGFQGVFLVPTEVLARQHLNTVTTLMGLFSVNVELLTGSTKASKKEQILQDLKSGECDLLIGTHAIFSENIEYNNIGLVVIDEQHKFGVEQRKTLASKGKNPDLLVMSATPIPRTLGYSLFGDMDVSVISQKPQGRLDILTSLYDEEKLDKMFSLVKKELEKGHQGYIVYPLVEESETLDFKSVLTNYEKLRKSAFKDYTVALLHGKMKESEKATAINNFNENKAQVLVATTVVEVGIDVPNATFIIIENAERFGLSSLHQLRGRVGRSEKQSYCYLTTPKISTLTPEAKERLNIMRKSQNGLEIAEKDLELRGVGDLLGRAQKGNKGLKVASLIHDSSLLEKARIDAFTIIEKDPKCEKKEHTLLKRFVKSFEEEYHTLLHN